MNDQRSTTEQLRDAAGKFGRWLDRTIAEMIDGVHKGMDRLW